MANSILNYTSSNNLSKQIKEFVEAHFDVDEHSSIGNEWVIFCPFHTNTNTACFYINKKTGLYYCHNPQCGKKGNFKHLLYIVTGKREFINNELEIVEFEIEDEEDIYDNSLELALDRIAIDFTDESDTQKLEYLVKRGFSLRSMQEFEIGFSQTRNRIVIPVRDVAYKVIGLIGRSIDESLPKYKYSNHFPRREAILNIHKAKMFPTVIVVEGTLDPLKVYDAGYENVVATNGSSVTKQQLELLGKYFNEIIIFSDNDPAGDAMRRAIMAGLPDHDISIVEYPNEDLKDPGEMSIEEIQYAIENKKSKLEYIISNETY